MLIRFSIWLFLLLFIQLMVISQSFRNTYFKVQSVNPTINSSSVFCTEDTIFLNLTLTGPFYGALRAFDSIEPECMSWGNASHDVAFRFRADRCGTINKIVDGRLRYDTEIYVQYHPYLMGPADYRFNLLCTPFPRKVTLTTKFTHRKLPRNMTSEDIKVEEVTPTMESKMPETEKTSNVEEKAEESPNVEKKVQEQAEGKENMKETLADEGNEKAKETLAEDGKEKAIPKCENKTKIRRMEDTEQIDFNTVKWSNETQPAYAMVIFKEGTSEPEVANKQNVLVGESLRILVKANIMPNVDQQVTDCFANDGTNIINYPLIDSDGCPLKSHIMPAFEEKIDTKGNQKIFSSHFQAFRFVSRNTVQVMCTVGFCRNTCPKPNCDKIYRWSDTEIPEIEKVLVYQSYEVSVGEIAGSIESVYEYQKEFRMSSELTAKTESLRDEAQECISFINFTLMALFLVMALLVSIVITICMCVSARELKKRLMTPVPYGKFQDKS